VDKVKILLHSLRISNFKGVTDFTLILDGKNADIFGRNATSKTTLYDSFLWLLFGRDSLNRTDYQIKPQDESGNERHNLESIVEGILSVDSKTLKLKRMLSEKWVSKRGLQTKEFAGNETSYWVNDVPVKAKEYIIEINTIINENIFKLLTNPLFFNTNDKGFGWQDRRKILFGICGDVSDSDVIDSCVTVTDKSMLDLQMVINSGRTIENHKRVIAEAIKQCKSKIESIPARINEQLRSIVDDGVDYVAVEESVAVQKSALLDIEIRLSTSANVANLYRQKQQKAFGLRSEIDVRKGKLEAESGAVFKKLIDEKSFLESEKYRIGAYISRINSQSESRVIEYNRIDAKLAELRASWKEEDAKQFIEPRLDSFTCPTCEQSLPEDKREHKLVRMRDNFEKAKRQILVAISAQGKELSEELSRLVYEQNESGASLNTHDSELKQVEIRLAELENEIEAIRGTSTVVNYDADTKYSLLNVEYQTLMSELSKPIADTTTELINQKNIVMDQINSLNRTLNNQDIVKKAKARVDELRIEESDLAREISSHEFHDYLIKQFTSAKAKMLEDSINKRFKTVRFKMFDTLNDGTEKEICRTLVNTNGAWVEFDGANNGGKINAGLDIINFLSEYYGASLPLFVDNAESVTSFVETKAQLIKLIVPPSFDQLDEVVIESLTDKYGGMYPAKKDWDERNSKLRVEVLV